jgi:hypothetical protein
MPLSGVEVNDLIMKYGSDLDTFDVRNLVFDCGAERLSVVAFRQIV